MPSFSASSLSRLATTHPDLQKVFHEVIKHWDCTILEGERIAEQQRANVAKGVSKTMDSEHLHRPARAVDVAPYPLRWPKRPTDDSQAELKRWMKEMAHFYYFAGFVLGIAEKVGVTLRHGGDWDRDRNIHDNAFDDLPHFELWP